MPVVRALLDQNHKTVGQKLGRVPHDPNGPAEKTKIDNFKNVVRLSIGLNRWHGRHNIDRDQNLSISKDFNTTLQENENLSAMLAKSEERHSFCILPSKDKNSYLDLKQSQKQKIHYQDFSNGGSSTECSTKKVALFKRQLKNIDHDG